jgi:hypothetical protein
MPDQKDIEVGIVDRIDRQRCSVKRHRPLGRDEAGQRLGGAQGETAGFAFIGNRNDLGLPVNMAGDHVAAELVADLQRSLQIDPRAGCPGADGGQPQRFFPGLDLKPAGIVAIGGQCSHREADPRTGNRGADIDAGRIPGGLDAQTDALIALGHCGHPADIGDDAGKHGIRPFRIHPSDRSRMSWKRPTGKPRARWSG